MLAYILIPWKDCDKHYIGETQRNLEKKESRNINDQLS